MIRAVIFDLSVGDSHIHSSRTLPTYSHVSLALQLAKYPLAVSQLAFYPCPSPDGPVNNCDLAIHRTGTVSGLFAPSIFAPRSESSIGNLRSQEQKFPGTFVPGIVDDDDLLWSQCTRFHRVVTLHCHTLMTMTNTEEHIPSLKVDLWYSQFASDHGEGCWRCTESKSKNIVK